MAKTFKKTYSKLDTVYGFIINYLNQNGYTPSIRDICEGMKISSPSLVKYYIDRLESNGKIMRGDSPRRVIMLPQSNATNQEESKPTSVTKKVFMSPIVGQVTAGTPILALQNISDYYPLPTDEFPQDSTFMLKVIGNSMQNAGIHDGDFVIVNNQKSVNNADIIVAMWDDCATVKRFFIRDKSVVLHPENEAYSDIIISNDESLKILGVVVGLIRKF